MRSSLATTRSETPHAVRADLHSLPSHYSNRWQFFHKGALAFYMLCFKTIRQMMIFIVSYAVFVTAVTYLSVASMLSSSFGSQAPCNKSFVAAPFGIPGALLLFALALIPWLLAVAGIALWKIRAYFSRRPAETGPGTFELEGRLTGADAEVAAMVIDALRAAG